MGNARRSRGDVRLVSTPDDTRLRPDGASALEANVQAISAGRERSSRRGSTAERSPTGLPARPGSGPVLVFHVIWVRPRAVGNLQCWGVMTSNGHDGSAPHLHLTLVCWRRYPFRGLNSRAVRGARSSMTMSSV